MSAHSACGFSASPPACRIVKSDVVTVAPTVDARRTSPTALSACDTFQARMAGPAILSPIVSGVTTRMCFLRSSIS